MTAEDMNVAECNKQWKILS